MATCSVFDMAAHGPPDCWRPALASGVCARHERWAARHPHDVQAQSIIRQVARARADADTTRRQRAAEDALVKAVRAKLIARPPKPKAKRPTAKVRPATTAARMSPPAAPRVSVTRIAVQHPSGGYAVVKES